MQNLSDEISIMEIIDNYIPDKTHTDEIIKNFKIEIEKRFRSSLINKIYSFPKKKYYYISNEIISSSSDEEEEQEIDYEYNLYN